MRSRSDIARSKTSKPSAVERTPDLPNVEKNVAVKCQLCHATPTVDQLRSRVDGTKECPECGNVITDFAPVKTTAETKPKETPPAEAKLTETHYCIECASEWPTVNGKPFPNCGHTGHAVDDPRLAKKIAPPAGFQERILARVRELNEADERMKKATSSKREEPAKKVEEKPARLDRSNPEPIPATAGAISSGPIGATNRISIPWGKSRMPVDRFNYFEVGGFIATVDLPEGVDIVSAANEILNDLEKIAEEAFRRQRKWYLEKLGILGVSDE